jgi:hypothetical protein
MTQHIPQHGAAGKPRAIETVYKNYKFRSRLEARWAVAFDKLGLAWTYEEEGFELPSGRYLPDFFFPDLDTYVEIKGRMPTPGDNDMERLMDLSVAKNCPCFLFAGDPIDLLEKPQTECFTYSVPAGHAFIGDPHIVKYMLDAAGARGNIAALTKQDAHELLTNILALAFEIMKNLKWQPSEDGSDITDIIATALHTTPGVAPVNWVAAMHEEGEKAREHIKEDDPHFTGLMSAMRFVSSLGGERMDAAAKAARQARFEFGAKP